MDCGQLWQDQFITTTKNSSLNEHKESNKRHYDDISEEESTLVNDVDSFQDLDIKKRRMSTHEEKESIIHSYENTIDK